MAMKKPLYFRQTYGLPKNQTDDSKGNSTANIVLKGSFLGSSHSKYVGYIKKWIVYAKDVSSIKIHHALVFLSAKFDKGIAYCAINIAKCVVTTNLLHIRTYPSINKYPPVMKYITGTFNLRPAKPKLSNVLDVETFFRYHHELGD